MEPLFRLYVLDAVRETGQIDMSESGRVVSKRQLADMIPTLNTLEINTDDHVIKYEAVVEDMGPSGMIYWYKPEEPLEDDE